jgi:hypothetical protein
MWSDNRRVREQLRGARPRAWLVAVLAALLVCAGAAPGHPLHAHHSLSGVYDSNDQTSIEGVVVQFHFVNPHPYLTVRVTEAGGRTADWRLEMDNRFELEDIGMTSQTLRPGDRVTARGSRGHGKANSLYVRRLERPADQFWYEQVGSSPRMRGRSS